MDAGECALVQSRMHATVDQKVHYVYGQSSMMLMVNLYLRYPDNVDALQE